MELLQNELRPKTLNNVIGQRHLIGEGKMLSNLVKNKKLFNIILYGKSGIGKTTIALCLINDLGFRYRMLNATINSKKDFEVVFEEAKMYGELVLIVDEIHRMNKDKQDLLLSYIESGLIILIGLTSSNPFHSINPAIRSRCELIELKNIEEEDIVLAIKNIKKVYKDLNIDEKTIKHIAHISNGDLRSAYNLVEFCYYSFGPEFSIDQIEEVNSNSKFYYDKNEDGYYDVISAFQKSIRGSDVNAALHYLARLIEVGDFDILYRRMLVIAYEDIGLANPSLPSRVLSAIEASERLGLPELYKPLACVVIDMALSPKSNSVETAMNNARNELNKGGIGRVPRHITTTSKDYKYPHNYPNHWVNQQYLPDNIKNSIYYIPGDNKYETELNNYHKKITENKK